MHTRIQTYYRSVALLLYIVWGSCGHAQEFLDIDWGVMRIDSTLPVFTHNIPLQDDYTRQDYEVQIEYPEFENVTNAEATRLKAMDAQLPEWPEVESFVGISAKKATLHTSLVPLVRRGNKYQRLTSLKLNVITHPRQQPLTRSTEETVPQR